VVSRIDAVCNILGFDGEGGLLMRDGPLKERLGLNVVALVGCNPAEITQCFAQQALVRRVGWELGYQPLEDIQNRAVYVSRLSEAAVNPEKEPTLS
jgi:hypothetical protein